MGFYISELSGRTEEGKKAREVVDSLRKKYNISLKFSSVLGDATYDSAIFCYDSASYAFRLSGFPGNCSSLVISQIQSLWNYGGFVLSTPINYALELAEKFGYTSLHISTTESELKNFLMEKFGFRLLYNTINKRTDRLNYFLVVDVDKGMENEFRRN